MARLSRMKVRRGGHVGPDAPHARGGHNHSVGGVPGQEALHRVLPGEVQVRPRGGDEGTALGLQPPTQRRAHQAAVPGDIDPLSGQGGRRPPPWGLMAPPRAAGKAAATSHVPDHPLHGV